VRGRQTSLAAVREAALSAGYEVEGLAPTSKAAQKLGEAGMATETLQRHLARGERADDGQKRLYVVDEASMASTLQMHTFVERLRENDSVLFVGDARQHEAVEAGRPYAQLQEGQTSDRVLIHVDSDQTHRELLNSRMAYVSVSRAQYDVQVYTNDAATLGQELSRDISKSVALEDVAIAKSFDLEPVQQVVEQLGLSLSL
jgi:ATP-dependent exoDNAse (exonuclease V) alpha subunit